MELDTENDDAGQPAPAETATDDDNGTEENTNETPGDAQAGPSDRTPVAKRSMCDNMNS